MAKVGDAASETFSLVRTPYGGCALRVRALSVPYWVGGRGYVPTPVYEVAVRTPRTIRERQAPCDGGFVTVDRAWLRPDLTIPADAAEVHVAVGLDVERRAEQRYAAELAAAEVSAPAPDRAPCTGAGALRRVKPAQDAREALRRLLCARCRQLERTTGEDATETRHAAAWAASADRSWAHRGTGSGPGARVSSSTALDADEMAYAVSWVEHKLAAEGFDFEADQAAYEERCRLRLAVDAERATQARATQARAEAA